MSRQKLSYIIQRTAIMAYNFKKSIAIIKRKIFQDLHSGIFAVTIISSNVMESFDKHATTMRRALTAKAETLLVSAFVLLAILILKFLQKNKKKR